MEDLLCIKNPNTHPKYLPGQWSSVPAVGEIYCINKFVKEGKPFLNGIAIADSYELLELPRMLFPIDCFASVDHSEDVVE